MHPLHLSEAEIKQLTYEIFYYPDYLLLFANVNKLSKKWFDKLKKRSMRISSSSERERLRLFQRIMKAERLFKGML